MSTIQGFFARAGMKTVEQFEKLKQDAEKSFGIEAELDDPVLKEVQNIMVEEEDALVQIAKMSNELIDSVTVVAKRDASDMLQFMRTLVENRGTKEQKYRILGQIDEYATIHEETTSGEDAIANWLVLELQANVLNQVAKHLTRNTHIREKFWRVKELKRQVGLLGKISSIDKKSKTELAVAQADFSELEKELIDQLQAMKDTGVATVDAIWNEYIRIEAEYYTKMNDAYLEPSTPRPVKAPLGEVRTSKEVHIASPEIGEAEDEMEQ